MRHYQLLREFAPAPWLANLDLDRMQRLNTKFHADTGERRESDLIWRIPRRDAGDAYLMLLLEFQSTIDPWMALRLLVYAGLLWQHLIREQQLLPDGRLPPILPIVLYNSDPRWRAPLDLRDLIGLPDASPLWQWQPTLRYHVIDEGAFPPADLAARDSLPALLFRLENAPDEDQLLDLANAARAWFARHPGFQAARAVFVEFLSAAMAPLGPTFGLPEELLEVRNMLATRVEEWKQQWLREGEQRGELRGEQRGEQKGRQSGEADLLLHLLEHRFGDLPSAAKDRVQAADTAMIKKWASRVLDAASLNEVLDDITT